MQPRGERVDSRGARGPHVPAGGDENPQGHEVGLRRGMIALIAPQGTGLNTEWLIYPI